MKTMEQMMEMSAHMRAHLAIMKRLFGADWDNRAEPYRAILRSVMAETKNDNPLSAVIPLAKGMEIEGNNPALLMAVAVEMAETPNIKREPLAPAKENP